MQYASPFKYTILQIVTSWINYFMIDKKTVKEVISIWQELQNS